MRITVECSEETGHAQMRAYYSGGFDATEDMDLISEKLLENVSVETEYMASDDPEFTDCVKIKLK